LAAKGLLNHSSERRRAMKKYYLFFVLAVLMLFVFTGNLAAAQGIKVGVILPVTGEKASFGEIEKRSFEMAVEEINAAGGVKGQKIEVLFEDDTGKPDIARSAAEKLITKDNVVLLGGGYGSSETYAIAGVAQAKGVPFLVNTGSADKITKPKEYGIEDPKRFWIFRLNPPVSGYASGVETFLAAVVKPKTCVILHENTLFGTQGADEFEKQTAQKLGIKVLKREGYESGAVDFKPLLVKVKQANPDLVYMISYIMDASLLMKQAMELKLTPKLFVGGAAGFTLPEFSQNAGKAAEKVISATLWSESLPIAGAKNYYDKFIKKYGKPTEYHGAEAYAAMYVIADALKRAKSFSREDIKQALAGTALMTVFGPVKFTSYEGMVNQNKMTTYVVQWINGKLELIWPKALAKVKYVYPIDFLKEWGYK
jgi:branched-chain amino acid transport system substrate-binding protein